jgi:hypothetical protein
MKEPRYLGDQPSEPPKPDYLKPLSTTARANAHEKESAARSGAKRTPGSGNKASHKKSRGSGNQTGCPGDLVGDEALGELKTTQKTDTRIQLSWLRKIAYEAMTQGKQPMVEMQFERLTPPCPKEWVMIPADFFNELMRRARNE